MSFGDKRPTTAACEVVQIAQYVSLVYGSARNRLKNVANAVKCGFSPIDENARPARGLVIRLARLRRAVANKIKIDTGPFRAPPTAAGTQRLGGWRRRQPWAKGAGSVGPGSKEERTVGGSSIR
jgi:hypothetical protein